MFTMYGNSVTGLVRKQNQDRYACGLFTDGTAWAIVCDGMGGPKGGEIAAEIAVSTVKRQWEMSYSSEMRADSIQNMMHESALLANNKIFQSACKRPDLIGMGTTMVSCIWRKDTLFVLHAGDSRLYSYTEKAGELTQLTHDHSMVQNLVDHGEITKDQANRHPERNLITKAVGVKENFCPDFTKIGMPPAASLLLCTDGLNSECDDAQIQQLLQKNRSPQDAVGACINEALKQGGHDNITAVFIRKSR